MKSSFPKMAYAFLDKCRKSWKDALIQQFRQLWFQDGDIVSIIVFVVLMVWLIVESMGLGSNFSLLIYPKLAAGVAVFFLLSNFAVYGIYVLIYVRPKRPLLHIARKALEVLDEVGWLRIAFLVLLFTFFFSAISSFKTVIPLIVPYDWDVTLSKIDSVLHGGVPPWRLLHPYIVKYDLSMGINLLYNVWFVLVFLLLFWILFDNRRPELRKRYILSYILCWVLNGSLLAVIFSSVGPCFYGMLYPDLHNPYEPLMAYLGSANLDEPVWAVETQRHLWELYLSNKSGMGAGISAMPSMHVSLAWLMFLLSTQVRIWVAMVSFLYALIIMIGSVHLAWHYMLDGYVSVLSTTLIWFGVGLWCRKSKKWTESRTATALNGVGI